MAVSERRLKKFMYANLYHHPSQLAAAEGASAVVAGLFTAYSGDAALLPELWRGTLPSAEPAHARHIGDFLAGMTDRFAVSEYARIYGRTAVPEVLVHV